MFFMDDRISQIGFQRIVGAFSRLFKDLLLYIVSTGFLLVTSKIDYFTGPHISN